MRILLAFAGLALVPSVAHADQCLSYSVDTSALVDEILKPKPKLVSFCEPCGDKVPGIPFERFERDTMDLAYTYVQVSPTRYENLAMMVGCPVHDVSPSLAVSGATEHGVLITADSSPVTRVEKPEPPPPVALPTDTRSAPQVHYYATTIEQPMPWLIVALAAGGGLISGAGFMVLALSARRRQAMRPRAADLKL